MPGKHIHRSEDRPARWGLVCLVLLPLACLVHPAMGATVALVPTGGVDTSDNTLDLAAVGLDDGVYDSYKAPPTRYSTDQHQEFTFTVSPFPAFAYITNARVRINLYESNLQEAQVQVWRASQGRFTVITVDTLATDDAEMTIDLDVTALLDSITDFSQARVRFLAYRKGNAASEIDLVELTCTYELDTEPPAVQLVEPADSSLWTTPIDVMGDAIDTGGSGLDRIELEWAPAGSGGPYQQISLETEPSFARTWAPGMDAFYDIRATAYDRSGNSAADESFSVRYDGPPVFEALTPRPNSSVGTPTPLVSFEVLDALDGVDPSSIVLLVNGIDVSLPATKTPIPNGYRVEYLSADVLPFGSVVAVSAAARDGNGQDGQENWVFYIHQRYRAGDIVLNVNHTDSAEQQIYDTYGLVLRIAAAGVDVDWIISQSKAYGGPDESFFVDTEPDPLTPGADGPMSLVSYLSGPFVIRDPIPETTDYNEAWDTILPICSRFSYSVNFDEILDIRDVSREQVFFVTYMPRIAANDDLSIGEMDLAQIPYLMVPSPGDLTDLSSTAGGGLFEPFIDPFCGRIRKFDLVIQGHYDWESPEIGELFAIGELDQFIAKAGMGIFECLAASIENSAHWVTNQASVVVEGVALTGFLDPDARRIGHPFLQTLDALPVEAGAFPIWASDANDFADNLQYILFDPQNGDIGYVFGAVGSGKAYYMGGHQRQTLQTRRLLLNALLYNVVYPKYTRGFFPTQIPAGEETEVLVTIKTTGGSSSLDNVVSDALDAFCEFVPGSVELFVPGSSAGYDAGTKTLRFAFGDFNPHDYPDGSIARYKVLVNAPVEGSLKVTDHTNSYTDDWDARYTFVSTGCAAVRVVPVLTLKKTSDLSAVPEGKTTRLTLTLYARNNLARTSLKNVNVEDTLPPGVAFVPASIAATKGTADWGVTTADTLTWDIGELAPGETQSLRFQVDVTPAAPDTWLVNDGAAITGETSDGIPLNGASNDVEVGVSGPVLDFTLSPGETPALGSERFTFCATNIGTAGSLVRNADAVTLRIPEGFGAPVNIVLPSLPLPSWNVFWDPTARELRFTYEPSDLLWISGDAYCFDFDLTTPGGAFYWFPAAGTLNRGSDRFAEDLPVEVIEDAGIVLRDSGVVSAEVCELAAHPLVVENQGTFANLVNFDLSSTAGWRWILLNDVDGSGTPTAADLPLLDTDSDGRPDTGWMAPQSVMSLLLVSTVPMPGNMTETVSVSAVASRGSGAAGITLTVNVPVFDFALTKSADGKCPGDPVQLSATPGFASYLWSTGETAESIEVAPGASTVYSVTVRNSFGCKRTRSVQVAVLDPPLADAGPDLALCEGSQGTVGTPGLPGLTYLWSPESEFADPTQPVQTVGPLVTQAYAVTVTDSATGCVSTDSVLVTVFLLPEPTSIGNVYKLVRTGMDIEHYWQDVTGTGVNTIVASTAKDMTLSSKVDDIPVGQERYDELGIISDLRKLIYYQVYPDGCL